MNTFLVIVVIIEGLLLGFFIYQTIKPKQYDGKFIIKRQSEDEALTILEINNCLPNDLFKKKELYLQVIKK